MKLYHHPFSTFSRRIRMQLAEKGVSVDESVVRLEAKEHKSDAYRALNPYGRVPTLVHDDLVLYESSAIMEYLESVFPQPSLLPASAQDRARVAMHVKLCDLEVGVHTYTITFPRRFVPRERWNLQAQNQARDAIQRHLEIVGRTLGDRAYLVGDAFSLADLAYCILTPFVTLHELTPPDNVRAWMERIEARPSAQATRAPR